MPDNNYQMTKKAFFFQKLVVEVSQKWDWRRLLPVSLEWKKGGGALIWGALNRKNTVYEIDAFISKTKNSFPWAREQVSEDASEGVSTAERSSEASSEEQANEWAVQANEWADERVAHY